jgi:hypothetical protein
MQIARTLILTVVASVVLSSGIVRLPASGASAPSDLPPTTTQSAHEPIALTPAERELVKWVTGRFALVGLDIPEVDVSFHDNSSACEFHDGIYHGDGGHHRVLVCIPDRGTFASNLERQRTLVHELAHVWEQAKLHDAGRRSLLSVLDAEDWYGTDVAWEDRGAERFAETIVWGLYDQLRRPTLIDAPCAELHADFHSITGHTAPSPVAVGCGVEFVPSVMSTP